MAFTKCGHCNGTSFEVSLFSPRGGNFKLNFVQCASCGVPVAVQDYYNLGQLLKVQEEKIGKLAGALHSLDRDLSEIKQLLRRK